MPRISVLLPIYNADRYLSLAIDSILLQSFPDFELILLDDGSDDDSLNIAEKAAARDGRTVVVTGNRRGIVHWLNVGLQMAKGDLIARMDADDISTADRFLTQVRYLDAHPECGAVGSQVLRIDPDGSPIDLWSVPRRHCEIDGQHMRGLTAGLIHPTVMMRKDLLLEIGGYRPAFEWAEDYDLFMRMAEVGELANVPNVLLRYRLHAKSITLTRSETQYRLGCLALQEAWRRRQQDGPVPAVVNVSRPQSEEELIWNWARGAFTAGNFGTARKLALKILQSRPSEPKRWALFCAACLGPLAFHVKRLSSYRVGPYRS